MQLDRRNLAISLLLVVAFAAFAQAECRLAEAQKSSGGLAIAVSPSSLSGQLSMQIYVQKGSGTQCNLVAELSQAPGYTASMSPLEISFNTSYAMYYPAITAQAQASASPETLNIRFLDKETGAELATVPVSISVTEPETTPTPTHICTKENTRDCTTKELLALDVEPSLIEENLSDVYLLVGIILGFALIALIFFVVIPRK